jgi:hypothetical protein
VANTLTADEFARRAMQYRLAFGFDPQAVAVRSCEETGQQALAHVAFRGHNTSASKYYKDGVRLRLGPDGWKVVLPPNFGHGPAGGR